MFEFQDSYAIDVPSTFMVQFMSNINKLFSGNLGFERGALVASPHFTGLS